MAIGHVLSARSRHAGLLEAVPGISSGAATDLLLVESGARSLVRLSCAWTASRGIGQALERRGFAARRWRQAVAPARTIAAGDEYVVAARASDARCTRGDERAFVFVARDEALLELAESLATDDAVTGALFGYPPCCVKAFIDNRAHYLRHLSPAFDTAGGRPLPFWANTMADAFGWHLISHFPCSSQCAESRAMAVKHWAALASADPAHAVATLVHMRSVVVCSEWLGLAYGVRQGHDPRCIQLLGASSAWARVIGAHETIVIDDTGAVRTKAGAVAHDVIGFDFTGFADDA